MTRDALARLDAWISAQQDQPTRPEAVRRLIEVALSDHNSSDRR